MTKQIATIAVASDLHCHGFRNGSKSSFLTAAAPREPVGQHPIESAAKLVLQEKLQADVLVCPGDLTDRVCEQGLHAGWDYLNELRGELEAGVLIATLGNHDVDSRHQLSPNPFQLARGFRPRAFPSSDEASRAKFWSDGFYLARVAGCDFLVLNSVAEHFDAEVAKRGSLELALLDRVRECLSRADLGPVRIAVVHHHPLPHDALALGSGDLMENGETLLELLQENRFRLIVHGHKHHPRIRYSPQNTTGPVVFAAGSFSAMSSELLSNTRNLFHIIELFEDVDGCSCSGRVRSWEFNFTRGWAVPSPRSADFPAIAGFGCRLTPADLVPKIVGELDGKQITPWEELVAAIPVLDFVLPKDLEFLEELLGNEHGIQLWPRAPERPEHLVLGAVRG